MGEFNKLEILGQRYTKAIMKLATSAEMLDKFNSDLLSIEAVLEKSPDLKDFLEHPVISKEDKKDIIKTIFSEDLDLHIVSLLKLLIDNNRAYAISTIISCFKESLDKKRNIITTQVTSAIEIDEDRQGKLVEKLERILEKKVKLQFEIDESIIAGLVVQVDDKIIDGSIRTKLDNMKRQLI